MATTEEFRLPGTTPGSSLKNILHLYNEPLRYVFVVLIPGDSRHNSTEGTVIAFNLHNKKNRLFNWLNRLKTINRTSLNNV